MIRVGVVGFGFSSKVFHLPFICSEYQPLAMLELTAISSSKAEEVNAKFPDVEVFDSAEALILKADIDIVVITSPNNTHYALAKLALENGLHVVLEKPMATSSNEAEELVNIAKHQNRLLTVFHNRRWDGDYLTVKSLLESQTLGNLHVFESHFDRFRPNVRERWRELPGNGTGVWWDLGSHLVDQALQLFGLPRAITAFCKPFRERSEVVDYFGVTLHYTDKEVILKSSPFSAGPNPRFKLQGDGGTCVIEGLDPQEQQLKNNLAITDDEFGFNHENKYADLYLCEGVESDIKKDRVNIKRGRYSFFYENLVNAIRENQSPPVCSKEVIDVIKVIELAEQSASLKKTVEFN